MSNIKHSRNGNDIDQMTDSFLWMERDDITDYLNVQPRTLYSYFTRGGVFEMKINSTLFGTSLPTFLKYHQERQNRRVALYRFSPSDGMTPRHSQLHFIPEEIVESNEHIEYPTESGLEGVVLDLQFPPETGRRYIGVPMTAITKSGDLFKSRDREKSSSEELDHKARAALVTALEEGEIEAYEPEPDEEEEDEDKETVDTAKEVTADTGNERVLGKDRIQTIQSGLDRKESDIRAGMSDMDPRELRIVVETLEMINDIRTEISQAG